MEFAITLSQAAAGPVTYDIATQDNDAQAASDYVAASATGSIVTVTSTGRKSFRTYGRPS